MTGVGDAIALDLEAGQAVATGACREEDLQRVVQLTHVIAGITTEAGDAMVLKLNHHQAEVDEHCPDSHGANRLREICTVDITTQAGSRPRPASFQRVTVALLRLVTQPRLINSLIGPRHDNDHASISNIALAPTQQEVLCPLDPYLPPNQAGTVVHLHEGSPEAHLDLHFRLLRHDAMSALFSSVQQFQQAGGLAWLQHRGNRNTGRFAVRRQVSFDELTFNIAKSQKARQEFWEATKRLQKGTLVLLWTEEGGQPTLAFAIVVERDALKIARAKRPFVGLRLCEGCHANERLLRAATGTGVASSTVMLQAAGSFFAVEPVLRALQHGIVPMAEYIAATPGTAAPSEVGLPAYLSSASCFNLSLLIDTGTQAALPAALAASAAAQLSSANMAAFPLEAVQQLSTLDAAQAQALQAALTRQLALIQGPPGTGKSTMLKPSGKTYLGIQLVRVLLANTQPQRPNERMQPAFGSLKPEIGPILCVCYTNHALDQFLEGLLEAGVKKIVRCGGRQVQLLKGAMAMLQMRTAGSSKAVGATSGSAGCIPAKSTPDPIPKLRQWNNRAQAVVRGTAPELAILSAVPTMCWAPWMTRRSDRPVEELLQVKDAWVMSRKERKKLHDYWQSELQAQWLEELKNAIVRFESARKDLSDVHSEADLNVLRDAQVVGFTTSGVAANQRLVTALAPKVVVVEEAAEVLEAHILASLSPHTQHLILIGDHEQLRPKPETYELQLESGRGYNLDVSLFERLAQQSGFPVATLQQQRRMRPAISRLIRSTIYPDLQDHPQVASHPAVRGMLHNVFFWHHDHPEGGQGDESRSKFNTTEAAMAARLAKYLLQQGYGAGQVTIVTPYVGQLMLIRKAAVRVAAIDNYQGEESDVIILSLVRNNKEGAIGFLKTRNRINVMLSRAKHGMYILGNVDSLCASRKHRMWPQVLEMLEADDCVGPALPVVCQNHPATVTLIQQACDFDIQAKEGGCTLQCEARLPCGHKCTRQCHVDDPHHLTVLCPKPCPRLHTACQHACPKLCGDECGLCMQLILRVALPCGHIAVNVRCHLYVPHHDLSALLDAHQRSASA
ncbi:hypothetical protein WJX72_000022 [[Myrmecia] bisecta]|uniref:Uncharacterized protein n=1 Tax=[Myrmecia] bisecta TaxID=41462 RepID=A0AAW1PKI6_9CHLO